MEKKKLSRRLLQDLRTALIAVVAASVVAAPTAVAVVANADKVDRKHAVGAGASRTARAGKLVATNSSGFLPGDIIAKAKDADLLDGKHAAAFLAASGTAVDADKLDGLHLSELGLNDYQRVRVQSGFDSTAEKAVSANCPAGTRVVGGGASVFPSLADSARATAPVMIRRSDAMQYVEGWSVGAFESAPYGYEWWVSVTAICAR